MPGCTRVREGETVVTFSSCTAHRANLVPFLRQNSVPVELGILQVVRDSYLSNSLVGRTLRKILLSEFTNVGGIVASLRVRLMLVSLLFCSSVLVFSQVPTVASVVPSSGVVGTQVTITGTNFGATQGTSAVTFNGVPVTSFTNWSTTSIPLPPYRQARQQALSLVTVGSVASKSYNFTVVPGSFTLTGNLAAARNASRLPHC